MLASTISLAVSRKAYFVMLQIINWKENFNKDF